MRMKNTFRGKIFIFPRGDSFAATTSVAIGRRDVESSQVRRKTKFPNERERERESRAGSIPKNVGIGIYWGFIQKQFSIEKNKLAKNGEKESFPDSQESETTQH